MCCVIPGWKIQSCFPKGNSGGSASPGTGQGLSVTASRSVSPPRATSTAFPDHSWVGTELGVMAVLCDSSARGVRAVPGV